MADKEEASPLQDPPRFRARRIFAVAMIVMLVILSIVVVVTIAKDGSTKQPQRVPVPVSKSS
jgi:hypothetical protein